jgi:hypothetical protein
MGMLDRLTNGIANMNPENASHRGPYLSERYPGIGAKKVGTVKARNIRPAPIESHYRKELAEWSSYLGMQNVE